MASAVEDVVIDDNVFDDSVSDDLSNCVFNRAG